MAEGQSSVWTAVPISSVKNPFHQLKNQHKPLVNPVLHLWHNLSHMFNRPNCSQSVTCSTENLLIDNPTHDPPHSSSHSDRWGKKTYFGFCSQKKKTFLACLSQMVTDHHRSGIFHVCTIGINDMSKFGQVHRPLCSCLVPFAQHSTHEQKLHIFGVRNRKPRERIVPHITGASVVGPHVHISTSTDALLHIVVCVTNALIMLYFALRSTKQKHN